MKTKSIFGRDEIAHVWVHMGYSGKSGWVDVVEGRTASYRGHDGYVIGNQSFNKDKFYSYSTQLAQRYKLPNGDVMYLINSGDYGPTTQGQRRDLHSAIPREDNVHRLFFPCDGHFPAELDGSVFNNNIVSKYLFEPLLQRIKSLTESAPKKRNRRGWDISEAQDYINEIQTLCRLVPTIPIPDELATLQRELWAIPEYIEKEKVHNPNSRRYITDFNEAIKYLPNLPMLLWKKSLQPTLYGGKKNDENNFILNIDSLANAKVSLKLLTKKSPWAMIRVIGDKVVTSKGVRMGIDEAMGLYGNMLDAISVNRYAGFRSSRYTVYQAPFSSYGQDLIVVGCHYFHVTTLVSQYNYLIHARQNLLLNSLTRKD